MPISYAAVAGGTRVKHLIKLQRMYRQYAAYQAMLHIKQRMSVGIIAKYYTQYKIWQHLRTKNLSLIHI